MQHISSSSRINYSNKSLKEPTFAEKRELTDTLKQHARQGARREADSNLAQMGRYMRDIINSIGETNEYEDVSVTQEFVYARINDWSFFDESQIAGTSITKYIPSTCTDYPELESIATWVCACMSISLDDVFEVEHVMNLPGLPGSKLPIVSYNAQAVEKFMYTVKHDAHSTQLELTAHPFILYKFKNLKLYFITEGDLLIDFFFWLVLPAPATTASSSSHSSY